MSDAVQHPEHAKVYVVVPSGVETTHFHVGSPRLAHPEQTVDFVKEIAEEPADASR